MFFARFLLMVQVSVGFVEIFSSAMRIVFVSVTIFVYPLPAITA